MNIAEIKRIIQEQENQKNKLFNTEKIINRDVNIELLQKYLKFPNVLAILGIRRCGKSVLSWLLTKNKKCSYINFDDEAFYGIETKDLNNVLKAFYELYGELDFIILDEIQNIKGWELFVNRLRRTNKVIITGSNSQMLYGEIAKHLTGRHIDFVLFPFSFREFCDYKGIVLRNEYTTETSAKMQKSLKEYIEYGGMPESYKYGKVMTKTIFGDIVMKDIAKRYNIRSASIEGLAKYLISNFSKEISFNKLKNIFSIKKVGTIKNYVKYFENAYLIFVLERFSFKLKQQIIAPKKIYCMDTGIINAVSFKLLEDIGRFYENVVCIELHRRKSYLQQDREIYYWKDHQQREVDFLVKEGRRVTELIQVCYDIDDFNTKDREIKALLKASHELKCKNMLVITDDYEAEEKLERFGIKGTIKFIPLWKWLLQ